MTKISVKLKNNGENKKTVVNELIQLELFPLQLSSFEEIMAMFTALSIHCLETENVELKHKISGLNFYASVQKLRVNDLLVENETLIKESKIKAETHSTLLKEYEKTTFANGRLATASIQLDEENKKLKAELEKVSKENETLRARLKSIKNFIA